MVEKLFDEFVAARERGEQPDVPALLASAGPEAEALGRLIDAYLRSAPTQAPDEETLLLMQARLEGEPPLLLLRLRRKLGREAVVSALMSTLRLDPAKRRKVEGYYHELETGLLPTEGVDRSVWDALGGFLHANVRVLAGTGVTLRDLDVTAAYLRQADVASVESAAPAPAAAPRASEWDEVDRLFTSGD
jgi:hypothetical protein